MNTSQLKSTIAGLIALQLRAREEQSSAALVDALARSLAAAQWLLRVEESEAEARAAHYAAMDERDGKHGPAQERADRRGY